MQDTPGIPIPSTYGFMIDAQFLGFRRFNSYCLHCRRPSAFEEPSQPGEALRDPRHEFQQTRGKRLDILPQADIILWNA